MSVFAVFLLRGKGGYAKREFFGFDGRESAFNCLNRRFGKFLQNSDAVYDVLQGTAFVLIYV